MGRGRGGISGCTGGSSREFAVDPARWTAGTRRANRQIGVPAGGPAKAGTTYAYLRFVGPGAIQVPLAKNSAIANGHGTRRVPTTFDATSRYTASPRLWPRPPCGGIGCGHDWHFGITDHAAVMLRDWILPMWAAPPNNPALPDTHRFCASPPRSALPAFCSWG